MSLFQLSGICHQCHTSTSKMNQDPLILFEKIHEDLNDKSTLFKQSLVSTKSHSDCSCLLLRKVENRAQNYSETNLNILKYQGVKNFTLMTR